MAQYISDRTPESISKRENLDELISGVKLYVSEAREEGNEDVTLGRFMGEVSLATDQDNRDDSEEERVTLMTMHAAKGLEFSNVFIVGVEEDLIPSSMSSDTFEGVEEERRLLYVAITRAKRFCMLSYASSRFRNGQTCTCSPSRFIRDIDTQYLLPVSGTTIDSSPQRAPWLSRYNSRQCRQRGTGAATAVAHIPCQAAASQHHCDRSEAHRHQHRHSHHRHRLVISTQSQPPISRQE